MDELTPITRIESYLDAIVDGGTPPLEDITRVETFLEAIYNNTVCELTPITRIETFLGKISGQDIELPAPVTRIELYLAAIAGEDVELPEQPITRVEYWLDEWANGGVVPEWATASGAIASFTTVRSAPLKELVANIDPVQDLHGYSNPWPAGGGVNKWHLYANGYYSSSGAFSPSASNGCSNKIPVTAGSTYSFGAINRGSTTITLRGYYFDSGGSIVGSQIVGANSLSTTAPTGATAVALWFAVSGSSDTITQERCDELGIQFSEGSLPATFTPYSNICPITGHTGLNVWVKSAYDPTADPTVSVSFDSAGTVYGGTLDVVSGELTVNKLAFIYDGSDDESWGSSGNYYYIPASALCKKTQIPISNLFKGVQNIRFEDLANLTFAMTPGNMNYINFRYDGIGSLNAFKAMLSTTPMTVLLELVTPQTYQLTGEAVSALLGQNNIWADTGNVSVTYQSN